jgi:hypothetical protein
MIGMKKYCHGHLQKLLTLPCASKAVPVDDDFPAGVASSQALRPPHHKLHQPGTCNAILPGTIRCQRFI